MPQPTTRRIPNLLHLLLFLALTIFAFLIAEIVVLTATQPHPLTAGLVDQKIQLWANALTYLFAFIASWVLFPAVWEMPFRTGLRWNAARARLYLIPVGVALGLTFQFISRFLPTPNKMPMDDLTRTPGILWLLVVFGVVFAPLFEEVLFRGFLLPGLSIAIDWLRLPRHPHDPDASLATLEVWRQQDTYSTPALVVSSVITSLLFAGIHALQLGFNWAPIALLAGVSLILCFIRIRYDSVAASTLVHASYNLAIFVTLYLATDGFRHLDKL